MKKIWVALFSLLLSLLLAEGVSAGEEKDVLPDLPAIIPDDALSLLPEGSESRISEGDVSSFASSVGAGYVLNTAGRVLKGLLPGVLGMTAKMMAAVLCSSLISAVCEDKTDGISGAIKTVSGACIFLVCLSGVKDVIERTAVSLGTVGAFGDALSPMLASLCLSGGMVTTASSGSAVLSLVVTLIQKVTDAVLRPLLSAMLGITAVSALSPIDLSGISEFIKKTFLAGITFVMALLSAVMAYQTHLAESADTVLLRTVRFASGFIPVVGAGVGEAAGSVLSGVGAIKSAVGWIGVLVVILIALPPLLYCFALRIGISLVSSFAGALGCERESKMTAGICGVLDLSAAFIASTGVMFIIAFALFSKAITV